jgi:hypothetical protein
MHGATSDRMLLLTYRALVTEPERMQRVQTLMVRTVPLLTAFTFCRLGYQVVRVLLLAWLTLLPLLGPLPQISHFLDMGLTSRAN